MHKIVDAMTGPRVMRIFLAIVAIYLLAQIFRSYQTMGSALACWNWTRIFGLLAFIVSFSLAIGASHRFDRTLRLLREHNTLALTDQGLTDFKHRMQVEGRAVQLWSGLLIFAIILGTYMAIHAGSAMTMWREWQAGAVISGQNNFVELAIQTLVAIVAASWAGIFFGRFAHYGSLARFLSSANINLRIKPDHFDSASGLKPIGDLYLYQALVFASPAIYLGLWWSFVIPILQDQSCPGIQDLGAWRIAMFFQWLVVMTYFYFGFIRPILRLRDRIRQTRSGLKQKVVPTLQAEIHSLQKILCTGSETADERARVTGQIDRLSQLLWSIRRMSDWPMDAQTRKRFFSLNAVASILPPLFKLGASTGAMFAMMPADGGISGWLQQLIDSLF